MLRILWWLSLVGILGCFVGIFLIGDVLTDMPRFLGLALGAFVFWGLLSLVTLRLRKVDYKAPVLVAGVIAVLLWLMPPTLSTDIYTYLWDGESLKMGYNPFLYKPSDQIFEFRHQEELYTKMYWKGEYTVYPPLAQLIFGVGHYFYEWFGMVGAKIWLSLPTLILAGLLFKVLDRKLWVIFILNPLLLIETFSGAHIDVWMMLFGWLAYWSYQQKQIYRSAIWLGLAILIKVIPVLFVPILIFDLIRSKSWSKAIIYGLIVGSVVVIGYIPFILESLFPILRYSSYSDVNEFNASVYRYLHDLGKVWPVLTHSVIKIILLFGLIVGGLGIALKRFSVNSLIYVGLLFLLLNSVVYPWYILFLLPLIFFSVDESKRYKWLIGLWVLELFLTAAYFDQIPVDLIPYLVKKEMMLQLSMVGYGVVALAVIGLVLIPKLLRQRQRS